MATVEELTQAAAEHDYAFSFLQGIPLGDAERLECVLDAVTYLDGKPFLYLKTSCECFHDSCDLAQTGDLAVGNVRDVCFPDERQHVMFAH